MSMPVIKPSNITRCAAINDVIESVALEQTGLSHILNAEGEKIQAALELSKTNDELLKVNKSVQSLVNTVIRLEAILHGKLELFSDCICEECPKQPCYPAALTFQVEDPKSGFMQAGNIPYTYYFTGNELASTIFFNTNPLVIITPTTTLPQGFIFTNNTLYIPAKYDWTIPYTMKFMVGNDDCQYEITINTIVTIIN